MHKSKWLPDVGNKRRKAGFGIAKRVSLAILMSMLVLGSAAAGPTINGDEDLGKIVEDKPPQNPEGADEGEVGQIDPNFVPEASLPFTEEQERKKGELELRYKDDNIGLTIDSIEPEAGPITGETRVLVRGGPFEDMTLLYPRPKCKFGSNDRIVDATYVKCHQRPLATEDWEGHSKDKVSAPGVANTCSYHFLESMVPSM